MLERFEHRPEAQRRDDVFLQLHIPVLALDVVRRVRGPDLVDDVDRLGGHLSAVEVLRAEQFHIRNQAARAYAHDQTATAEVVELGDVTGDGGRVVLGQVEYAGGELDVLGGI
ncbi:hypothetical protein D3C81_1959870 [compost metagenome]